MRIMNSVGKLAAALLLCAAPGLVQAAIITITECVAGDPPAEVAVAICLGSTNSVYLNGASVDLLTYTHDITDDGFAAGDTIVSATLVIDLNDDVTDERPGGESVDISINGTLVANNYDASLDFLCTGTLPGTCGAVLIAALQAPPPGHAPILIEVHSASANNDFFFADSLLTVVANVNGGVPPGQEIPEPATLLLLACGLVGMAFLRRRKNGL